MAKDYAKTKTSKKPKPRSSSSAGQESSEGRLWLLAFVLFVLFAAGLVFLKQESKKIVPANPAPTKSAVTQNPSTQETTPQPKFDFYSVLPNQQTTASSQNNSSATNDNSSTDQSQNQQTSSNSAASDANTPKSQIPAPSSDFSQPTTQQQTNSSSSSADNNVNSQSPQQDQASQPATSDTSSNSNDSTSDNAKASSDSSSDTTTPQEQVSDLVKQQLAQESDSSTSSCQHGIINPSTTNYVLQLGIFQDSTAADQQRAQLVIQGLEVKVKTIKKNGTNYYRIWMGPYKTKQDALKQQQQLQSNSIKSELIKQNN